MAVNIERSMNHDFNTGAVDHTIRLAAGQDRGGITDVANYYNNLVGSGANLVPGDFLMPGYLEGIVRNAWR